jgi:hypothetical protein
LKSGQSLLINRPVKQTFNIIVFPGGTEIGLEIQKALSQCKEVRLFSAGLNISNHAPYLFTHHFPLPDIHNPAWLDCLNNVIVDHQVDYIFPAHDDVIVALAQNAKALKAGIISSPVETCLIARSKSKTYQWLAGVIPTPTLYQDPDQVERYPVFMKPDQGQGSQRTYLVKDQTQLHYCLSQEQDSIITEYLPGPEFTVDCFSDREKGLLFVGGRERIRTRSGISMNCRVVYNDLFHHYAQKISEKLIFHGAWFFQLKTAQNGDLKLLEVAPRIAGTMAAHRVQGLNFPLLSLYEHQHIPLKIMLNPFEVEIDRALINRYRPQPTYNTVYVDLDDTLILNGKVNTLLVQFLYQAINQGKRIVLLTKHRGDLRQTLKQFRLTGIFDDINHLYPADHKADYVCDSAAILIDDSFSERQSVHERCGILTFDCSMLEMLIDERV